MTQALPWLFAVVLAVVAGTDTRAEVHVIVRDKAAPFADQDWPRQGLAVELLRAALGAGPVPVDIALEWEADGARFLKRAASGEADLALLVPGAMCRGPTPGAACSQFHFSDPLLHVVTLLFVQAEKQFDYQTPDDLSGRRVCRAVGDGPPVLDTLADEGKALLVEKAQISGCFDLLEIGKVDAVAVDEFTGVASLFAQRLTEHIVPLTEPLATVGLHTVASKTHWRATAHIYRVNAGLAELHHSGAYAQLLNDHLAGYWAELRASLR